MFNKPKYKNVKKLLFLIGLSVWLTSFGFAQTRSVVTTRSTIQLPDENAIVRDTAGNQYAYDAWSLLVKSGKYGLKANGKKTEEGTSPQYLLYSLYDANGQRIITEAMKRHKPTESEQFKSGDAFEPFKERDINGEKLDMKKMAGKVFVINFWFIGCPPCRAEIPDLNNIVDHYKGNNDVVFIAICLDETGMIRDFIKENPYNYHIISNGRFLAHSYGVHLYPTNVVLTRDGKVAYSSVGGVASNAYWMIKTIDEALQASVSIAPKTGK